MNVTSSAGVLASRARRAASPTPTRSREARSASASSSERRPPLAARSRISRWRSGAMVATSRILRGERGQLVELAGLTGQLQEAGEPRALGLAEPVAQAAQVA